MNKKISFRTGTLIIVSFLLMLLNSCNKDDNEFEPRVTDIDGNVYHTIKIGTQEWMAENLKTTKFNDGTPIPHETGFGTFTTLKTPAYCWYENDTNNKDIYGALYNWYVVSPEANGGKNICPAGWHVPTDEEWITLTDYLGGEDIAGGKLKETGTEHWKNPNTNATNMTGFTALPAGMCAGSISSFSAVGTYGFWWTSTADSLYPISCAWCRIAYSYTGHIARTCNERKIGLSIRCVKD